MLAMRCHRLKHVYSWFCISPPAKLLPTCPPFIISISSRTCIIRSYAPILCPQNHCRHINCLFLRSCPDSPVPCSQTPTSTLPCTSNNRSEVPYCQCIHQCHY